MSKRIEQLNDVDKTLIEEHIKNGRHIWNGTDQTICSYCGINAHELKDPLQHIRG